MTCIKEPLTLREKLCLRLLLVAMRMVRAYDYEHKWDEQIRKIEELI